MLNERLKELRIAKRITQVELASLLGVTKQSVSNWENDNIQPSIDMLAKIADVFCVSTDYLLGRDNRRYIEVNGMSDSAIEHIQQIVYDIIQSNK